MSDPNLLDSSQKGVLDSQLDLDRKVVLDVIRNTPSDEKREDLDFEEGGLHGWLAVLGASLVQFCGFGYIDAFGVFQDYYTRIYITNQSASAIAWIGSVNAFLISTSGVYAGILHDQGHFYHLLYGGSILMSFSLFMLSFAQPDHLYQIFLTQGIGLGLAGGMMYVPSVAVLSLYFKKKRTLAMTFASAGSAVGAVVHPIMINNLFSSGLGFRATTRASAGLITFALLIACILMRPKLPPPNKRPPILNSIRKLYKDWPYVAVTIGNFLFAIGKWFPLFFIQLDAIKHGISTKFAFNALVMMNGSFLVGCLSPGCFAHSLGVLNMLVTAAFCCTILIFAMVGLTSIPSLVSISVLFGYFFGLFTTLQVPLISILILDVSELGTRIGMSFTISAFGALIGPPIHGALLSSDFIWWRPAVFGGISALIGTSLFMALPCIKKRFTSEQVTCKEMVDAQDGDRVGGIPKAT